MSSKEWFVIVNKECYIELGYEISCSSKSKALKLADFIARLLYNVDTRESHVFVVKRETDDFKKTIVENHYSVRCDLCLKSIYLYDGYCNNQREILSKFIF